jgi:NADH:ubiquinone oxidoreductase subunit H
MIINFFKSTLEKNIFLIGFILYINFFFIIILLKIPCKIIIISLIIILLIILPSAYISLLERQLVGIIQQRFGPIYAGGLFSLVNPLLDGLKLFLRKNI